MIMVNWIEEYKKYPERREQHISYLNAFENREDNTFTNIFMPHDFNNRIMNWVEIAIFNNKPKAAHAMLDYLNVPSESLSLKERISYFQLVSSKTRD